MWKVALEPEGRTRQRNRQREQRMFGSLSDEGFSVVFHDLSPLKDRILSKDICRNRRVINEGGTAYITPFTDEMSVKGIF